MGAQTKQIFIVIMLFVVAVVVPVFVVPCGVSFPLSCCLLWSVVFLFFAPFLSLFCFLHKPNVSQTLIGLYFYFFYSQLGEEFWAATNCDKCAS